MRISLCLIILLLFCGDIYAQKYKTALGVRLGRMDMGLTLQQKIADKQTLEVLLAGNDERVVLTALFEKHYPVIFQTFNYYIGAGIHGGLRYVFMPLAEDNYYKGMYGFDGIVGLEYKFPLIPVHISLDLKPAVHINYFPLFEMQGAFSIRYILAKDRKKPLRERIRDRVRG